MIRSSIAVRLIIGISYQERKLFQDRKKDFEFIFLIKKRTKCLGFTSEVNLL
jgi:hypothetical protein